MPDHRALGLANRTVPWLAFTDEATLQQQTRAYFYAAASIAMWATVAAAFKIGLRHQTPTELLLWASGIASVTLALLATANGQLASLRAWPRTEIVRSVLLGLLNPCLYYLILFRAYDRLPAQEAQPLNFVWPLVLVVFSTVFLRQPLGRATLPGMAVSFLGVLVISTRGDLLGWQVTNGLGVALALTSTLVWAGYWTLGVRDRQQPLLRLLLNFSFGFAWVAVYAAVFESVELPPMPGLAAAAYVGLFEMGLTFFAWLRALQLSRSTAQVGGLIFLTPFLSLLVIHLVLGEPILPSTITGLVLIIGGILLQHYGEGLFRRR
jgi:drug/metabolite transporter (DMT)-like permease